MTPRQSVQTLGFFWLAATGLLLSTEPRSWDYQDFAAPLFGVLLYLVGRNWHRCTGFMEPWRLIVGIGSLSLTHAMVFLVTLRDAVSMVTLTSLILGGVISLGIGLRLRAEVP